MTNREFPWKSLGKLSDCLVSTRAYSFTKRGNILVNLVRCCGSYRASSLVRSETVFVSLPQVSRH